MSFDSLGLLPELLRAVRDQGYTVATPVQAQAIPVVLAGQDLIAGAQTGTGKTAAFTLPLLQRLMAGPALAAETADRGAAYQTNRSIDRRAHKPKIRALILTPTRELAMQVEESVRTYGAHLPLRSATVFGGVNITPQIRALRAGVDILVATPGRLLDHHQQGTIDFSRLEILILDEADRMLDMGFIRDIRKILALLPAKRQNLLFSATFNEEIRQLAGTILNDPVSVDVAPRNTATELVQHLIHPVDKARKKDLLIHIIRERAMFQALVFARTKHGSNHLAQHLSRNGISCAAIHGDKSQNQRIRALADFKSAKIQILVATDIAARGLDIDQLPYVINFELPQVAEDYVHRIGRTGRAGSQGVAISLVCVDELGLLRDIERLVKRQLPSQVLPGWEVDPSIRAEPLRQPRAARPPRRDNPHRSSEAKPAAKAAHAPSRPTQAEGSGQKPNRPHGAGSHPHPRPSQAPKPAHGGKPATPPAKPRPAGPEPRQAGRRPEAPTVNVKVKDMVDQLVGGFRGKRNPR